MQLKIPGSNCRRPNIRDGQPIIVLFIRFGCNTNVNAFRMRKRADRGERREREREKQKPAIINTRQKLLVIQLGFD